MAQLDENAFIDCLPANIHKDLVNALNKDAGWITLANHVAEQLQYPCTPWIQSLKNSNDSPGQRLLFELNIKLCTIEILRALLDDCGLHHVLSIISDPVPLEIIVQPYEQLENNSLKLSYGKHLRLFCKAHGMPPPSYMWYQNDTPLENCTSEELDIIITNVSQAGQYACKVCQIKHDGTIVSTLTSATVDVQIFPVPIAIDKQPQAILDVKEGESFTIDCKATGNPEPKYQWFHENAKLEGEISNVLHIKQFSSKHEGKYFCHVSNDVSEVYTERSQVMMHLPKLKAVAKIALIVANGDYDNHECLPTAKNDGAYIAKLLKEIGFEVICLMNLTITQMKNAIRLFSSALVEGVYGLFYFAGHGFKMQESYLLAADAPKTYLRKDALCESELLASFLQNDPELLIIILDMCQTLPSKEFNSDIYKEVPTVIEYKSKKNLRNLIQAYSTSSHRPSYERLNNKYGLYMTHLCKYINMDIPITKLFEDVGKSIDHCFKGKERNQIPMFASSVTKPFRLTDAIQKRNFPAVICNFIKLTSSTMVTCDVVFKQMNLSAKVTITSFMEPYLNIIKVRFPNFDDYEVNFFNSVPAKRNNLYQDRNKNECWIHNPQINEGSLVISLSKHGTPVSASLLHIKNYISPLLKLIDS